MTMSAMKFTFHHYMRQEYGHITFRNPSDEKTDVKCGARNIKVLRAEWISFPLFSSHSTLVTHFEKRRNNLTNLADLENCQTIREKYFTYMYSSHSTREDCIETIQKFIASAIKLVFKNELYNC
jgi:ABC-type uncharacterized transport system substrate-binding protein